jgi:large subunit ribosomal protein L21
MYAIVNIAGQQFKVAKGNKVFVHCLPGKTGDEVRFDKVLLISNDNKVNVGTPYLPDAVVLAQIVSQLRGDKVLVFKKKRRKGYQKLNGHRQNFTEILIEDISESGDVKKATKKKVETAPEKPVEITAEVEKTKKPVATKPVTKKSAEKISVKETPKKKVVKKAAPEAEKSVKKKATVKSKGTKSK